MIKNAIYGHRAAGCMQRAALCKPLSCVNMIRKAIYDCRGGRKDYFALSLQREDGRRRRRGVIRQRLPQLYDEEKVFKLCMCGEPGLRAVESKYSPNMRSTGCKEQCFLMH